MPITRGVSWISTHTNLDKGASAPVRGLLQSTVQPEIKILLLGHP